jgi:stage V sporulation protein R
MDDYGADTVEAFIDICLSVEDLIDPYLPFVEPKDPAALPKAESAEDIKLKAPRSYLENFMNPKEFLDAQKKKLEDKKKEQKRFPAEPQRDILKFVLDHSPLEDWQADVLSIIREEAYYFAPQRMTKIMNEGWASYWHSKIMTEKLLTAGEIIDFADRHAGVMATSPGRLNPYKLGIELFRHIEERWNKGQFGKDWDECDDMVQKRQWDRKLGLGRDKIFSIRKTHNDITFVDEFFTEEFCEEQKLYTYELNPRSKKYEIKTRDWREVKEQILASITNAGNPVIKVVDGNHRNRGELLLKHEHHGQDLDLNYARATLTNLAYLWRRPVNLLSTLDGTAKILTANEKGEFTEEKA